MTERQLVIVDADTVAGFRRASPSLAQLWQAVDDLRAANPDVDVCVLADPSLKWALSTEDQDQIDDDIRAGRLQLAPAGATGGHLGFVARVVERAEEQGRHPVVVTDQNVPGARLSRMRRDGPRWVFDLSGVKATVVAEHTTARRRR